MLVLSRKPGEQIVIGNNIVVSVISSRGNRIKLGISAPGDTPIKRSELLHTSESVDRAAPADCHA